MPLPQTVDLSAGYLSNCSKSISNDGAGLIPDAAEEALDRRNLQRNAHDGRAEPKGVEPSSIFHRLPPDRDRFVHVPARNPPSGVGRLVCLRGTKNGWAHSRVAVARCPLDWPEFRTARLLAYLLECPFRGVGVRRILPEVPFGSRSWFGCWPDVETGVWGRGRGSGSGASVVRTFDEPDIE